MSPDTRPAVSKCKPRAGGVPSRPLSGRSGPCPVIAQFARMAAEETPIMSVHVGPPGRRRGLLGWAGPVAGLLPGVVALAVARAVLLWDGSYYAFRVANEQGPAIFFHRWSAGLLQLPAVAAARLGGSPGLVVALLGVAYASVPLVAALLAWRTLVAAGREEAF